ncbi:site-specific DNA-methyltransferase [Pedobacter yonginense]|uniref:site-specific DNA-methyltransferase (adenine-specific) n=1 Tax=Pedobacter yonginense TaxID=651869 RepID=A0A317EKW3_9SPHI|nr:site-specific DNA-methyltransferase [Pedobacter yonginense]PWS25916.1 site-specific DNA-methyltransferase [Pedobacter yonginense]
MATSKYENYTKEQLIEKVKLLEKQRYGLVWEDKPEEIADQCERELPVLVEVKDKEITLDPTKPTNFIFEGDNYHTLFTLNFTHKRKVDVIYIDPPYNTGNKSWRYNNDYIDKEDRFRHSKWLSFMSKRLRLARRLLKETGIIICAIDDYEFASLKLLFDTVFGEQNRLGTLVVVHNPRGRNDDKFFASQHEYILVYAKNSDKAIVNHFELNDDDRDQYKKSDDISSFAETSFVRTGNNSKRSERPNLFYPIYYNETTMQLSLLRQDGWEELLPINNGNEEKTWRWGQDTFNELQATELFVKKVKGINKIYKKRRLTDTTGKKPKTVWYDPKYDASSNGIMLLQKILGRDNTFNYPKSIYAVKDILEITTNKDSLVLDFFAGSGTTGQAVLELNRQDNGNRQFILCTNNENQICEEVTYPRIKKVIEGYGNKAGIEANVKYFKTDYVPYVITDNDKRTLVSRSTELLCISENTFEVVAQNEKQGFSIFKNKDQFTAIIYDEDSIERCCKEIIKIDPQHKLIIYVFSYDHTYDEADFATLTMRFYVKPIPEAILNVYRKISKLKRK